MRVLHIITGLRIGGAEMMLLSLLRQHRSFGVDSHVISLLGDGPVGTLLREDGFRVENLGLSPVFPDPTKVVRLAGLIRSIKPDIVQTWMYHADLIGGVVTRLVSSTPVIWGIHITKLRSDARKWTTALVARFCSFLSYLVPKKIVSCSHEAVIAHTSIGYDGRKFCLINNGFDLHRFSRDDELGASVRRDLDIAPSAKLVGLFARYHPQKDHKTFVRAAAILLQMFPQAEFLLCGTGISWSNAELANLIKSTGYEANFHLLGERSDIPRLLSALDLLVLSSSSGEAFPMIVGEAMACETPCVVTDVGDAANMLSGCGRVVPPGDPRALASSCAHLLSISAEERLNLGRKARDKISERYGLEAIAKKYYDVYSMAIREIR